ncbi:peptide-methionine (S)-S-oxide reductase [Malonomonas rubra DSM 5091]|uniref:Peptide methionine sulfoxide reductase MsrA n=1 Tax=Malonomonas rubra DSM 5091 TaxID=1122189 RepID=A0A1M6I7I8_MALRU|nr:peptide-methionine (S)-S-oxide reductase MsrA [Malonomonas rubra]SHJ30441.1 peptide-methionine (S)-S-oxide reductase [Malonomonas rubra DSM 5091]
MLLKRILILTVAILTISTQVFAATTILAGGCFWCMESDFEKLAGVSDVVSGFSGGDLQNPTYNGNHVGHYEVVEITYDPQVLSYRQLLDYYWRHIDPFDDGGQFCDRGHSYKAAVFVANPEERKIAEESKAQVQELFPQQKVVTPILPATTFWPITGKESYHQDYYKKNPIRYNYYRWGCGRDQRVKEIWGDEADHG